MKIVTGFLLLMLVIGVLPAAAQDEQCLEILDVWSDDMRYEVNLDTGIIVTYASPTPGYVAPTGNVSPDGHYTVTREIEGGQGYYHITLVDNRVGVSFVVAENVAAVSWSPDSAWLAYIEFVESENDGWTLTLLNIGGGDTVSVPLRYEILTYWSLLSWSPDGSMIAVGTVVSLEPETQEVWLYSVPDLTLLNSYEMEVFSPTFLWSPSGRYLLAYGGYSGGLLIDTESGQDYALTLDGNGYNQFYWSPDESYLISSHSSNDWTDEFDVITMQGEYVLEDILIDTNYDNSRSRVDWVGDDRIIASTFIFNIAVSNLTLFDLQTGEQNILLEHLSSYELSHDNRYVAATGQDAPNLIQVFDLSQDEIPVENVTIETNLSNFIWRDDRLELVVLFEDRSLRSYDLDAHEWREIATLPGDERGMRRVSCVH